MRLAIFVRLRLRPIPPRMSVERILAVRRQKLHELEPFIVGEAGADADVAEIFVVIVKAEEQGTHQSLFPLLVPAETGDHTVGFAFVLHFQHDALVGLVGAVRWFGDDAVEPGPSKRRNQSAAVFLSCVAGVR